MLPQLSRRGPESNRCAGLCRPLPKPLGHPAGMEQPGMPGLVASLTCDRSAVRSSLRDRSRRTLKLWTRRIGVLSVGPTSFGRRPARVTSRSSCAGFATGRLIPGSDAHPQIAPRTSRSVDCWRRPSSGRNKGTVPEDRTSPSGFVARCYGVRNVVDDVDRPVRQRKDTHGSVTVRVVDSDRALRIRKVGWRRERLEDFLDRQRTDEGGGIAACWCFRSGGRDPGTTATTVKTATASNRVLIRCPSRR
jgi:hypothetical protein